MPLNCKTCGAPLKGDEEHCPYCGSFIDYEDRPKSHKAERKKNLPQMKYTSATFIIIVSIFTFGLYGIYWYLSNRKRFNELVEGLKFPDIGFGIYILGWLAFLFISSSEGSEPDISDTINSVAYLVMWCGALWMSFGIKKILKEYLTLHCTDEAILKVFTFSDVALFCFGYIYLQLQINKMIKAEIFAPTL